MRLSGKGVAPGQMDLVDVLGMYVAADRKAMVVALREVLGELVRAVDALHASDDVVRELVRAGVNVRLAVAVGAAVQVLGETEGGVS